MREDNTEGAKPSREPNRRRQLGHHRRGRRHRAERGPRTGDGDRRRMSALPRPVRPLLRRGRRRGRWRSPFLDDDPVRAQAMAAYIASRTKFFDEFFTTAGAKRTGSGRDPGRRPRHRAWRLPWISARRSTRSTSRRCWSSRRGYWPSTRQKPGAGYAAVAVDLRHDCQPRCARTVLTITPDGMVRRRLAAVPARRRTGTRCSSRSTNSAPPAAGCRGGVR